jgi:5'-nucleotidase (lipoprotein e(P4) family)
LTRHWRQKAQNPLAIITDIDDTIFDASNYWGYLISQGKDFFDDTIWDEWVPENKFAATPGSLDFLNYATQQGVEIFYISSRDQGPKTVEYALGNLNALGFPQADEQHVTILIESSHKEEPQKKVMENYDVVLMLGDNLNDFQRKYYVKDVDERIKLMEEDKDEFGKRFILVPNPTDGHWIRAIFGDSEPPASDQNRKTFEQAAKRSAWQGK